LVPSIRVVIGHYRIDSEYHILPEEDGEPAIALVDTGATQSCIDIAFAKKLELPAIDRVPIAGVSGVELHDVYMAQIHIPDLNFTQHGRFAGVDLGDLDTGEQFHHALLGRTFLQNAIMIYDGVRGQVTITVK